TTQAASSPGDAGPVSNPTPYPSPAPTPDSPGGDAPLPRVAQMDGKREADPVPDVKVTERKPVGDAVDGD
ncbi:MAG TPA: hypothetical protein VLS27_08860, partial [Gammaproteobacteria bacterium]|nr:hypothetical protein [Gammaproteobacteria bacterium]